MTDEVKITIQSEVAKHRVPASIIGATLGHQFCKPEAHACIKEFDKKVAEAAASGNMDILPNRTPRKFRVKTFDVLNVVADVVRGETGIVLNKGIESSEVFLPFNEDMTQVGKMTSDAFAKALKGVDKNIIFSDVKATVDEANAYNNDEIKRIERAIKVLEDAKKNILSAIGENNAKAKSYMQELADSKVETVEIAVPDAAPTTTIIVHDTEE